ncbi:MAG: hypothetical protein JWP52_2817, partial [Rhizobacter sp.]|nr:hypothetical protein [Rhizobacter sp.]
MRAPDAARLGKLRRMNSKLGLIPSIMARPARKPGDRRAAIVTTAIMLLGFGTAAALSHAGAWRTDAVIQAAVLAMSVGRLQRDTDAIDRLIALFVLPLVAMAGCAVQWLMLRELALAGALLVVVVGVAIWVRRFGPRATRAGTMATLPMVAALVVPASLLPTDGAHFLVAAEVGLMVCAWAYAVHWVAERIGRDAAGKPAPPRPAVATPAGPVKLYASTRMAWQMVVALGAAFVVGRWLFVDHWSWVVLTAFVVSSGTRGRGDVVHKGLVRTGGAALGTVAGAGLSGMLAGHPSVAITMIFVVLAVAGALRARSYAWWAGGVTAALSLLWGHYGHSAQALLPLRLEGVVIGAAIAIASSWWVLPVKTLDVVRKRCADVLASLTDCLVALRRDPSALADSLSRFDADLAQLEQVAPALRAHRRLPDRLHGGPPLAGAIDALQHCAGPLRAMADGAGQRADEAAASLTPLAHQRLVGLYAAVMANVAAVRRAIGRQPDALYRPPPS